VRVTVDDVELYVHESGEGRPLIALHGGPGLDGSVWSPALDAFAERGWRVLAPDLRGNGRSDTGDVTCLTVPGMADDIQRLSEQLGLVAPVVMGWSFGSFVAQSHMARHGTAAAYVLMGTVASPSALLDIDKRVAAFEPARLRAQVLASWEREPTVSTPAEFKQLMADQYPYQVADPTGPLVAWLIENDRVVYRPEILRHFAEGGEYGMTDLRAELAKVQRPVLILSGAHDRTTPAASARELADAIPGAEHVFIDGAAHMLPYEQPEAFHAALESFLTRVTS
jgi:pimeloyl-ACP methyl ester carboxylesterase